MNAIMIFSPDPGFSMIKQFNEMHWHDAILKEVIIDRRYNDSIRIVVRWPDEYGGNDAILEFYNCYRFEAHMNFGIIPPDFIAEAVCEILSDELDNLRILWSKLDVDLSGLLCFKFRTNSTNSSLKIYSLGFRLI
jgi:hypothetical protein